MYLEPCTSSIAPSPSYSKYKSKTVRNLVDFNPMVYYSKTPLCYLKMLLYPETFGTLRVFLGSLKNILLHKIGLHEISYHDQCKIEISIFNVLFPDK